MAVFDKKAFSYDGWYETELGGFVDKIETDLAFSLYKPDACAKILDVGCGTGNFSIKLAELGCEVVGIDVSQNMLDEANNKIKGKGLDIEFYKMDVNKMEFTDESFDGIYSMTSFEFLANPHNAYDDMHRVLKSNGHLLIGTINRESRWGEYYLSKSLQKDSIYKHAKFKTLEEMKSYNPNEIINYGECLFIPPDAEQSIVNIETEKRLKNSEKAGFICVLWQKGI